MEIDRALENIQNVILKEANALQFHMIVLFCRKSRVSKDLMFL